MRALVAMLAAGAVPIVVAPVASADDKKACVDAYVSGQRLRQESKLRAAREQLLVCAATSCPASLQKDCTNWSAEVEASIPTVVLAVKGPDGQDAVDVAVSMDGEPLVSKLDGTAIAIDPGSHLFRFEIEGADALEQSFVIRVGEKNRRITVDLGKPKDRPTEPTPKTSPTEPDAAQTERPIPPLVYVFAGLAVVGAAGFTVFALSTDSQVSELDASGCKPNCAQSDVDSAKTMQTLGWVSLGVGAVSLGAAAVFFFTRPEKPVATQSARADVYAVPGGAVAKLRARF